MQFLFITLVYKCALKKNKRIEKRSEYVFSNLLFGLDDAYFYVMAFL